MARVACIPSAKTHKKIGAAPYILPLFNHRERARVINKAVQSLRLVYFKFDTIVCSGTSGLIIAPEIARKLKKNLVIVRKNQDASHSWRRVEGCNNPGRYIFVDDLIDSGATLDRVRNRMNEERPGSELAGIWLYWQENISRLYKDESLNIPNIWETA